MIEVKNIHKSFGDLAVLKGVNLEVQKGEIVAIIGKSGAVTGSLTGAAAALLIKYMKH